MAKADQTRWDARYLKGDKQGGAPSAMLAEYCGQAGGKRALDVACGTGRNALFLAGRGFRVEALDISPVGLSKLDEAATGLDITTHAVDLENYAPRRNAFDLIVVANYLNRPLIPQLFTALDRGGILVMDTFMNDPRNQENTHNPAYLLKPREFLSTVGDGFETLKYQEFSVEAKTGTMWKQAIAVRKLR